MIHHKTIHKIVTVIIIASVLFCIGGLMTGWVSKDYKILRENPKIETAVIDALQKNQEADVIIILKNQETRSIQENVLDSNPGFKLKYKYSIINALSGKVDKNTLMNLGNSPDIEKIYLNKILNVSLDESVSLIKGEIVQSAKFKGINLKGKYQSVCVLDTGVDYNHPALKGRVISGYDFVNNDSDAMDDGIGDAEAHGTHVAGIIASNDTTYTGVAPEAKIIAVKVCDSSGNCEVSNILKGIEWCVENASKFNISVISMSFGDNEEHNKTQCEEESSFSEFNNAVNNATSKNIFVVASSGNNGHNNGISFPACIENITSVNAVDKQKNIWDRGNTGELLDLLAPGVDITSTVFSNNFASKTGTSMATPHVAGAALLMYQHANLSGSTITPEEIKNKLKVTGTNITDSDNNLSFPLINIEKAVLFSDLEIGNEINPYPKTNANITFYGNYTNRTNNLEISNGNCFIQFNDSINGNMIYNSSSKRYEYLRNFTSAGFYKYNITCNHSDYETLTKEDLIEVVKGSENCTYPGSNIDWNLTGDGYSRCVGENLIINQSNINIKDNATFILKDTNLTLVGASTHYVINVSNNANFSVYNSTIKGIDQSTKRLDVDLYGQGDIYNSTFENSILTIKGNKSHIINSSYFKYYFSSKESSITNIINTNFESYVFFRENSNNKIEDSNFSNRFYAYDSVYIQIKNSNFNGVNYILDNSTVNFTLPLSNLTNEIRFYNNPKLYGFVNMPSSGQVVTGNLTRYFPVYVYYTGTSTPYANKQVNITDNNSNLIWQGVTNSDGYVNPYLIFNTTNYGAYNFTISTNESKDIFLLTDTPVSLEAAGTPPGGDSESPGGGGGGSTCIENWSCSNWSICINNLQSRTCNDLNNCGTIKNKPNETQNCSSSYTSNHKKKTREIGIHGEENSNLNFTKTNNKKECCLFNICGGKLFDICWYIWVLIVFILTILIIALNQIKIKIKKRRKQKEIFDSFKPIEPPGIEWTLKRLRLLDKE
ncbi:hypothetical protein DRN73_01930 [Candidatus Pacearchaeota archaeon]|nr:MAG: hypothetical protein DRN73_01930 [Candidatus Pacearchaeota archaeon]